jgi:hypothetical protein
MVRYVVQKVSSSSIGRTTRKVGSQERYVLSAHSSTINVKFKSPVPLFDSRLKKKTERDWELWRASATDSQPLSPHPVRFMCISKKCSFKLYRYGGRVRTTRTLSILAWCCRSTTYRRHDRTTTALPGYHSTTLRTGRSDLGTIGT